VRGDALRAYPQIAVSLGQLAGLFDEKSMRGWNLRVEVDGENEVAVARAVLEELGLMTTQEIQPISGASRREGSFLFYMWLNRGELLRRTAEHLGLVGLALLIAVAIALPLALVLVRHQRAADGVLAVVGILQTIPSIALLAFMIPLFGVGAKPAVIALFLYALLPIVRNSYTGVRDADPEAVDSATALGMSWGQGLRYVRLPLAAPVILAGIRTAAVISVGTATLAAFIGAGGLGVPIVSGLQLNDSRVILSGALPAALLALLVDAALARLERVLRPRGVGDPK
jgi:osmoprotectant transport system permease protein